MPLLCYRTIYLIFIASLVCANDVDINHDHDRSRDAYTFVIDDLMWLVLLIVGTTLVIWLCCCMDPMFDSTTQYCCKQYTSHPVPCDPVIHVKISPEDSRRAYSNNNNNNVKNQPRPSLAPIKSFERGDPQDSETGSPR